MIIFLPVFLTNQVGADMSTLVFFIITIVMMLMLPGTISMNESKYEKAYSYLSITPYSRFQLVICKYIFDLIIFLAIIIIYYLETIFLSRYVGNLEVIVIAITFFSVSIIRGFIIPLEFKFGYEKTKYISIIVLMIVCFGVPLLTRYFSIDFFNNFLLDFILNLHRSILSILIFIISIAISILSIQISYKIFFNKEL